ncbi:MAG TPA: adenosylcobinamide-GDP ribazoletransferase [Chitinophagaceae bacterium]|jgi:adenosylcobinamide-GDP ribazoletransferase|nr:adenosylcobinamide-GDP ribazoletransferase [Chitinophagaceae bacterium]
MKRELRIFLTALMFLTRLPVYRWAGHEPEYLQRCSKYFPLVGAIVGALSLVPFALLYPAVSLPLAVLGSLIASVLTTGAFHEDGFADVCDAFGGGWTKEKILTIMKDSRLGTYGVAGLVFILAAKFLLLHDLARLLLPEGRGLFDGPFLLLVIAAHMLSRLMAVAVIQYGTYVYLDDTSKSKPLASDRLRPAEFLLAIGLTLPALAALPLMIAVTLPMVLAAAALLYRYFRRWIGGYTGDCLGAIQQVTEILFYLTVLFIWNYT